MTSILIIDDHPDIREAIITCLEIDRPDLQILVAENGLQGICAVNRYRPDLILVNGRMPIMGGISTVDYLRNITIPPNSRVIGMSGFPRHHPETVKMRSKCDGFLAKPFPPEMLSQTIDNTLNPLIA